MLCLVYILTPFNQESGISEWIQKVYLPLGEEMREKGKKCATRKEGKRERVAELMITKEKDKKYLWS